MAKTLFILIFTLAAFRGFAQPALPTTNQTFAPIANPYSGSWIYYTTSSVSGLGYLNGASIPYVTTVSNNIVTYINAATNGFVTAAITNGLATTNFVLASQLAPAAIWSGVSGNTLATNSTHYAIPNNSTSMTATGQTNGVTSVPATENITLTNLYVVTSGTVGSGSSHTSTLTIMTNGVVTSIAVSITGTSQTTGNDTTHSVTVPAGTTIGIRVVTGTSTSTTAVYWSWSFEGW